MINKNELRIGNWVKYKNKPIIVDTIYYDSINMDLTIFDGVEIELLKPIPLTEEILLKCGFMEDDFNKKGNLYLPLKITCLDGHLDYLYVKEKSEIVKLRSIRSIEIKHLHQLQNLIYALTNQELNIEL